MSIIKRIDFIMLCSTKESTNQILFSIRRINELEKEPNNIVRTRVILVPIGDHSEFIKYPRFRKQLEEFPDIEVIVAKGNTKYATEPRAWNYGLNASLSTGNSDFIVFLHDTDTILDNRLLSYYMWLFESAHNPDLVGAVTLSSNVFVNAEAPTVVKMWYADDVFLRGTCVKTKALRTASPFDEALIYRAYEMDFFSRLIHHYGWLTRVGKEPNNFIQFGPSDATPDHEKLRFIKKQSLVWNARKWNNIGLWPDHPKSYYTNCYMRYGTFSTEVVTCGEFLKQFSHNGTNVKARFEAIYHDNEIKQAVNMSKAFIKKPIGTFNNVILVDSGAVVYNNTSIMTHVNCKLEYPEVMWNPKHMQ